MAVLDASFLVDLDRRQPGALRVARKLDEAQEPTIVPFVVALEASRGAKDLGMLWARLRDHYTIVGFTDEMAEEHAALARRLTLTGRFPGMADFVIAATALSFNETLYAADRRGFEGIPGLQLELYR